MIGVVILLTIVAAVIYQMTKNWMISGIVEVIGVAIVVALSFVKAELFENLLVNLMEKLYITEVFENIAVNRLFDVSGLVMYLTVIAVFVFFTMQSIQKRRWS